jgi:hypothetical protein
VVRLFVDVVVLFGVDICESSMSEYTKYSASPNPWGMAKWMVKAYLAVADL